MAKLILTFEVDDDLTSERQAQYRAVVVESLHFMSVDIDPHAHGEELELIDHLLEDVNG